MHARNTSVDLTSVSCRVPLRVDLAGGWSDIPPFAQREGGAVLNIAIQQHVTGAVTRNAAGIKLHYELALPTGAGLGSSAALNVAWLALVRAAMGASHEPHQLAQDACAVAEALGITGGKQDEYATALGGVNLMRFGHEVVIEPLTLSVETASALEESLILCFTGESRLSADTHDRVWGAYERGDQRVASILGELRDTAIALRTPLVDGDIPSVAALIRHNWTLQKELHPSITNPRMDSLVQIAEGAGALAAKACGAGGGGCLAIIARPGGRAEVVAGLQGAGAEIFAADIDWSGLSVTFDPV